TEKASVTAACEQLIEAFLKPRFLPAIEPTEFNYPVDILGKWHGAKYRFIQRYRSGFADNLGEEFDAPFARLDWISRDRFDIRSRRGGGWNWVGVVSGSFNPNDSGVGALERRPRHDKGYHERGDCGRRGFAFR
ncbi:MAG TPA: hypothetical protein VHZ78_11725, partial [Rhizomicrobium sp.]|nr:hypothetical protein [Rhizomicrobium sp.]